MMNLRVYAISFYLLISCLTSVNGQVYIGLIKQSGTNNCIAVPEGKAVAGQDLTTSVIYFEVELKHDLSKLI